MTTDQVITIRPIFKDSGGSHITTLHHPERIVWNFDAAKLKISKVNADGSAAFASIGVPTASTSISCTF
jgi:hypothetical protein